MNSFLSKLLTKDTKMARQRNRLLVLSGLILISAYFLGANQGLVMVGLVIAFMLIYFNDELSNLLR